MTTETYEKLLKLYHEKFGDFVPMLYLRSADPEPIRKAIKTGKELTEHDGLDPRSEI